MNRQPEKVTDMLKQKIEDLRLQINIQNNHISEAEKTIRHLTNQKNEFEIALEKLK